MRAAVSLTDSLEKAEARLAGYSWQRLLRHVLCPALVHLEQQDPADFAAVFLHEFSESRIAELRSACEIPLLLCGDYESGEGFPSMFGCGVVGDSGLAYTMGRSVALRQARKGIHWTLAPVCDLALDIDSPMVGLRSAGEIPERVMPVTTAYIRGLQDHGMAATAKHFPGDGFNSLDQHITTPVNRMSEQEWKRSYGRTFRAAIDAGVFCVMPGHIALEWCDGTAPATVSKRLLDGLLRKEMGFEGVIVSDAMGMGGVAGYMNVYDASAAFLEAGGDCLLFARYDAFFEREMERCLLEGKLREETLLERAIRLLRLKHRLGLLADTQPDCREEDPKFVEAGRLMTAAAVQIVRDEGTALPLSKLPGRRILHVILCNNPVDAPARLEGFGKCLETASGATVETWVDPGPEKLFFTLRERPFAAVVVSLWNQPDYGTNTLRLHGPVARNLMDGWMHFETPVIFVQHGHPFHHRQFPAAMRTVINTHGGGPAAFPIVAQTIFATNGMTE